jgi:hypothetical protein
MSRSHTVPRTTARCVTKLVASIAVSTVLALTGCAAGGGTDSGVIPPASTTADGSGADSSSAFHDLNGQWELFSATDAAGQFNLSGLALLGGAADVTLALTFM